MFFPKNELLSLIMTDRLSLIYGLMGFYANANRQCTFNMNLIDVWFEVIGIPPKFSDPLTGLLFVPGFKSF